MDLWQFAFRPTTNGLARGEDKLACDQLWTKTSLLQQLLLMWKSGSMLVQRVGPAFKQATLQCVSSFGKLAGTGLWPVGQAKPGGAAQCQQQGGTAGLLRVGLRQCVFLRCQLIQHCTYVVPWDISSQLKT